VSSTLIFGEHDARFPGATVYATEGTIEVMRKQAGEGREQLWDKVFPGLIPESPILAQPIPAEGFLLEGQRHPGHRRRPHRHRPHLGPARAVHRPRGRR
jgi:hypothetical protein